MPKLAISLLGRFEAKLNGEPLISFISDKARALLAYLVVEAGRPHRRAYLAGLFWADQPEKKALQSLRMALSNLRKVLGDQENAIPYLFATRESLQFNPESDFALDVKDFLRRLEKALAPQSGGLYPDRFHPGLLRGALELYQGHFLDQFFLKDSSPFEEWASLERENLSRQMFVAVDLLAKYHERRGEISLARKYASRLVALVPWDEYGHRELIRYLGMEGHWSAAGAQYRSLQRILQEELNLSPGPGTEKFMDQIRDGEHNNTPIAPRLPSPVQNLPPALPHFVGRQSELDDLLEMVLSPDYRLVTLVGPGGIGKTRLAQEAGHILVGLFEHGVYFVPLSGIFSSEDLLTTIAGVLGYTFQGSRDPLRQLLGFIGEKNLLIILDNCEHLLFPPDGENLALDQIIVHILLETPNVKILATSRQRLNLRAEWLFPVDGLPYPPAPNKPGDQISDLVVSFCSVQLFEKIASQVSPRFRLQDHFESVSRICRLMDGLPLGIELAAAWVRHQSPEGIAVRISADYDALQGTARDIPARHRSLSAVFKHSWDLLSQEERQVLERLSVFRGGFDFAAAVQVCGATRQTLVSLVDKSLLQGSLDTRYSMHGIIRQFAAEWLSQDSLMESEVRKGHAEYYGDYINQQAGGLRGAGHTAALKRLQVDVDNIRAAWSWAVEHQDISILSNACAGLHQYYDMQSWFQDGARLFKVAAEAIYPDTGFLSEILSEDQAVAARLRMYQGWFLYRLDRYPEAIPILENSLSILRAAEDLEGLAAGLLVLGHMTERQMETRVAYYQECLQVSRAAQNAGRMIEALNAIGVVSRLGGEFERSQEVLAEGLALCQREGDSWGESKVLNNLGFLTREMGNYQQAKDYHLKSLEIKRAFQDLSGVAMCYSNLGMTAQRLGDLREARDYFQECIAIYDHFGNVSAKVFCLGNLGQVASEAGDYPESLRLHQEAYRTALENQFDSNQHRYTLINLGEIHLKMGDYQNAWEAFQMALQITWEGSYIPQVLEILAHTAELIKPARPDLMAELLQVVKTHPCTTALVRQNADRLVVTLGVDIPEDSRPPSLEELIPRLIEIVGEIYS